MILCLTLTLAACGASAKTFTKNGLTITLTSAFQPAEVENYSAAWQTKDIAILALEEKFSLLADSENMTLEEYRELCLDVNDRPGIKKVTVGGQPAFEFDYTNNSVEYHYLAVCYKASDAFWLVQFATVASDFEANRTALETYASSVTFGK